LPPADDWRFSVIDLRRRGGGSCHWGDGTVTQGTIVAGPFNSMIVQGSHTYSIANTYTLHITITPLSSGPAIAVTDSELISALRATTNILTGIQVIK